MSGAAGSRPDLEGVLVVDKPAGMTSQDVVGAVRRAIGARRRTGPKVGHAGTLDPQATGVLVVAIGRATRLVPWLQASRKTYDATMRLGARTDTLDADGEVLSETSAAHLDEAAVCDALGRFTGELAQVPPMVSALKVDGERLHAKARRGETVEREPRTVVVDDLVLEAFEPGERPLARFLVTCSTGTYVRSLAADVGEALGVGAHLTALRRLGSGRFDLGAAVPLEVVVEAAGQGSLGPRLLSLAEAVADFPARWLDAAEAAALSHGRPLPPTGHDGPVAAIGPDGDLVAMIADRDGAARPEAVLAR
ncbi:MAG: tRNA pseudouridine(55) synthase TruB [Actinomycetota bacterium]